MLIWTLYICVDVLSTFLSIYLGVLGDMVTLCNFEKLPYFSTVTAPFSIHTSCVWGFQFLYILANTCYCPSFDNSHFSEHEVMVHYGFLDCICLASNDVGHPFTCLLAIIFFRKKCLSVLCPSFQLSCLLIIQLKQFCIYIYPYSGYKFFMR